MQKRNKSKGMKVCVETRKNHTKIPRITGGTILDILKCAGAFVGGAALVSTMVHLERKGYLHMNSHEKDEE